MLVIAVVFIRIEKDTAFNFLFCKLKTGFFLVKTLDYKCSNNSILSFTAKVANDIRRAFLGRRGAFEGRNRMNFIILG